MQDTLNIGQSFINTAICPVGINQKLTSMSGKVILSGDIFAHEAAGHLGYQ